MQAEFQSLSHLQRLQIARSFRHWYSLPDIFLVYVIFKSLINLLTCRIHSQLLRVLRPKPDKISNLKG